MKQDVEQGLHEAIDEVIERDTRRVLMWIIVVAVTMVLVVFGSYFATFHGVVGEQSNWGQFGDFIGGTLNPILSFLTLMALLFTVTLQTRQLELGRKTLLNSSKELAATRAEMTRSSDAQAAAAKAAHQQARYANISIRLSALQAALTIVNEDLQDYRDHPPAGGGAHAYGQQLLDQRDKISSSIVQITDELFSERPWNRADGEEQA